MAKGGTQPSRRWTVERIKADPFQQWLRTIFRESREAMGLSRRELARQIGRSFGSVRNWEQGFQVLSRSEVYAVLFLRWHKALLDSRESHGLAETIEKLRTNWAPAPKVKDKNSWPEDDEENENDELYQAMMESRDAARHWSEKPWAEITKEDVKQMVEEKVEEYRPGNNKKAVDYFEWKVYDIAHKLEKQGYGLKTQFEAALKYADNQIEQSRKAKQSYIEDSG